MVLYRESFTKISWFDFDKGWKVNAGPGKTSPLFCKLIASENSTAFHSIVFSSMKLDLGNCEVENRNVI